MCGVAEENMNHLLLNCEMVAKCWSHLQEKLGWEGPWSPSLKAFFIPWPRGGKRNYFEFIWRISPSIVIWEVWKERNKRIFQDKIETLEKLLNIIDHSIEEVVNAAVFRKKLIK